MHHIPAVPQILARTLDAQPDGLPPALVPPVLPTPWWRLAALLHGVHTWMTAVTRRPPSARQDIRPDFPRQETPVDILARKHTFLYAQSLSG